MTKQFRDGSRTCLGMQRALACSRRHVLQAGGLGALGLALPQLYGARAKATAADGVFPNTEFLLDLAETNEAGEIEVDRHGRTGVRGCFAAGDATDVHDKQVVIAAGQGASAALAAFEYLGKQV